ncbi:hypothetical protein C0993_008986 [Termitomyces sp. T159_Od127]|nr:hypothetical protein C0993_008986 [Termitomyces sp. T159_Od127]
MINDDESDLTEIEDSEDEQPLSSKYLPSMLPPSQLLKKPPLPHKAEEITEKRKLRSGPRLDEPHLYADTVQTIYHELKEKIIDVDPEYQRSVVWDDTKQGYLIDSLMNNYVVFPLVFAERKREGEGVKIKVCIDGKQRITAIQQFRDGKISYRDSQLNHQMWYEKVPPGKKGIAFTPAQRQRFNSSRISICKYPKIEEHDEREVFQRVQNGVALSTHERLKAVNGPNGDLVREMYRRTSVGLRECLHWEQAKGKDFFMLGQMAIIIKESIIKKPPATQITLSRVETFLNLKTAPTGELLSSVLAVIKDFNSIYKNPQLMDIFENIQPQFFVMAGVMIHLHRKMFSVSQLADAVRQMKKRVKADTAAKIYKKLLTFVTQDVLSLELKGPSLNASNRSPSFLVPNSVSSLAAVTRTPTPSAPIPATKCTQTAQTTPQRKRTILGDDDDISPEATTHLTKRRRVPPLRFSDDEDDNDDNSPVVRRNPPRAPVTSRPSILVAVKASSSVSKAQTKVRPKPITTTPNSTTSKGANGTQMGRPSIIAPSTAARARDSMTAGVATMSATENKSVGSQQKEAPPVRKYTPTPPASASTSRPSSSHHASPLFDEPRPSSIGFDTNRRGDNIHNTITTSSLIPSSGPSTRLGPLLRAKQLIQDQTLSHGTIDPRPRSRQASHQAHEANFQSEVDQIGNSLRSSATSAWASANQNPLSPAQQVQTPVVPSSGDVNLKDGINHKGLLCRDPPPQRKDSPVPARKTDKPPLQGTPVGHSSVPSDDSSKTNVEPDRLRNTPTSTVTPGMSANGNEDEPPIQPVPPSAAMTPSEQKISYRQMPPIPKRSSQSTSNPTVPMRVSEARSGTRLSASRASSFRDRDELESRYYRPHPGYEPQRRRSRR